MIDDHLRHGLMLWVKTYPKVIEDQNMSRLKNERSGCWQLCTWDSLSDLFSTLIYFQSTLYKCHTYKC